MKSPTVLVIGGAAARSSGHVYDICARALRQLKKRDCRIALTDTPEHLRAAPELVAEADEVVELDYTDPDACVSWVRSHSGRHRITAVVAYREFAQVAAAEVAAELGLPGNLPDVVRTIRNKEACRAKLRAEGFRQPDFRLCRTVDEGLEFLSSLGGRAVVKPTSGAGSTGVSYVTAVEFSEAFAAACGEAGGAAEGALVEAFVSGPEFSVEGMWISGVPHVLAVTEKRTDERSFVETGHVMPAPLDEGITQAVSEEVLRALRALKLSTGLFHVECWLTPDGPVLGEVHARQGGDWIHAMLEWCRPGLELYAAWCDDLHGRLVQVPPLSRGAATRFVVAPPGTVTEVAGWEDISWQDGVLAADCRLRPGSLTEPLESSGDRHGFLVVGGPDASRASRRAEILLETLAVSVAPSRPVHG